jgi:hypothetical protein
MVKHKMVVKYGDQVGDLLGGAGFLNPPNPEP